MTMEKIKPLLLLPLLAFLAACGPGAAISTATDAPTRIASPTPLQESACQRISLEATPDAKISSLFPPVGENDNVMGPRDAPMTIIEYGDFQ
jgi:hypothetical protein